MRVQFMTTARDLRNWVWEHAGENMEEADIAAITEVIRGRADCPRWGTDWAEFLAALPELHTLMK